MKFEISKLFVLETFTYMPLLRIIISYLKKIYISMKTNNCYQLEMIFNYYN